MAFAKHLLDFFGLEWQVTLQKLVLDAWKWEREILVMVNQKKVWGISEGCKIESWPY